MMSSAARSTSSLTRWVFALPSAEGAASADCTFASARSLTLSAGTSPPASTEARQLTDFKPTV